ncbi:amino acid adenylation domain-containing protein [Streptomyces flavofungini]|uniref:amino acid adenylation domain-containing protein n=1 Tax=Streptomyces flavofungini TaxID=68200 RepID=UPI0034DEB70F
MSDRRGLHDLFTASAARTPHAPAVIEPSGPVSYGELDERADALAGRLRGHGIGKGDRVLIWSPKSAHAIAAMQAVLRLGAIYVPVDPLTPPDRFAVIARESGARALCAPDDLTARVPSALRARLGYVGLDAVPVPGTPPRTPDAQDAWDTPDAPSPPTHARVAPDDLAYILYTSGSTGTPKGVCVSHRNALAFIDWAVAELAPTPHDRFANHSGFSFDLSVLDLYAAFSVGAAVCPIHAEYAYAPERLVAFLHRERISVWYSVPSVLTLMLRDGGLLDRPAPASLRALLFAGEPFPIGHVRALAAWCDARLLNLYGPTETNVCTFHEVVPADLMREVPVPIGGPCGGDQVWARRPDGTRAAPGEEGELVVSGPTVFAGYWGRPPQEGPYATGDRVIVRPDGSFDYLGRRDAMVKIRGHRIELGDVVAALHSHPGVAEAAVVPVGEGLDRVLAAFVVRARGSGFGNVALRRHLAARLAPHMIPGDIRFVDELPHTSRGKLDLAALQSPLNGAQKVQG